MQKLIGVLLSPSLSCQAAHLTAQERILAMPLRSFSEVKSVKQLKDEPGVGGRIAREAGRTGLRFAITAVVVVVIIAIAAAVGKN